METADHRPLSFVTKLLQFFGIASPVKKTAEVTLAVPAPRTPAPVAQRISAKPVARWIVLGMGKLQKTEDDRVYSVNIRRNVAGMSGISVRANTVTGEREDLRDEEIDQVRKSVVAELQQRGLSAWLPLLADEVQAVVAEIPQSVSLGRSPWQVLIAEDDAIVYTKVLDSGEAVRVEARHGWVDKVFYQPIGGMLQELSMEQESERRLYLQLRNRIRVREELVNMRAMKGETDSGEGV